MGENGNRFRNMVNRVMRDVTAPGDLGLHRAIDSGSIEELQKLLKTGVQTCIFDQHGMAPIHKAATVGRPEVILLLVAFGANVNIQNPKTGMTALHYAKRENSEIIRLLLSCGVDMYIANKYGKRPDPGLFPEELQKFDHLKYLIQYRIITTVFDFVAKKDRLNLEKIGPPVERHANTSEPQTFFYCRRIPKEHLCICNGGVSTLKDHIQNDSMAVISDVYEYFVKVRVEKVEITVPIFRNGTKYDDLYLINNSGRRIPAKTISNVGVEVSAVVRMDLEACTSSLNSFVIVMQSRTERFTATGHEQLMASSLEEKFTIDVPEDALPENTEVSFQVVPTDSEPSIRDTDAINKASNFHEIRTNQKNKKSLTLSIPLPEGFSNPGANNSDLVVFQIQTPCSTKWKPVTASFQFETGMATAASSGNGTYIVTELSRQSTPGILTKVGKFFYHLYETVCRRQTYCSFFAMPKHISDHNFRILVGVAEEDMKQTYVDNLVTADGFEYKQSQTTSNLLCAHNSKYDVSVDPSMVQVRGLPSLELVYLHGKPTHQHFLVASSFDTQFVTCTINRINGEAERTCLTQIHVELTRTASRVQEMIDYAASSEKDFPYDTFISELVHDIGFECIMIGVCLGINHVLLEEWEGSGNMWDINQRVFTTWRKANNQSADRGVKRLIQTLALVERNDIVHEVDRCVRQFSYLNPEHTFTQWVKRTISEGSDNNNGCACKDHNPCISHYVDHDAYIEPWGESRSKYLVKLACKIGYNEYLLTRIGCKPEEFTTIRRAIRLPSAAMFKCLMISKRKYGDAIHFYQDLLTALSDSSNNRMIDVIISDIKGSRERGQVSAINTLLAKYNRSILPKD